MDDDSTTDFQPERHDQQALSEEYIAAHADIPSQPPSGGDFYAAFPVPESSGDIAVVMGDIAGHGPEQTMQAAHMRTLLEDCIAVGLTPAETLSAVNAMVEPDPHFEGFGTVFVGTLEHGTGKITYASGGHEPALIADPAHQEEVTELEGTGPPVGAFPPELARFEEHQAALPAGGTLLLYTDGVSDASPPESRREWLGTERLKQLLAKYSKKPPKKLIFGLLGSVARFCQGYFHDDVAVMAIRRLRKTKRPKDSSSL